MGRSDIEGNVIVYVDKLLGPTRSGKAMAFRHNDEMLYLPIKLIQDMWPVDGVGSVGVDIPKWLAKEKGLYNEKEN
jgi:hypothetical protein